MEALVSGSFVKFINPAFDYKGEEKYTMLQKIVDDWEKSSTKPLAESGYNYCQQTMNYILEMLEDLAGEPLELPSFTIMSYDWNEEYEDYEGKATPDDNNPDRPNFFYKPTGLKVWWYKYPFRSAELSQDLTLGTFENILGCCKGELDEIIKDKLKKAVHGEDKRFLK